MERASRSEAGAVRTFDEHALASVAADTALFRAEVVAARRAQWLGTVLLAPQLSHRVFTLVGVLAAAALLALAFGAHYTRTARVSGWLVPQQGVVRVMAPRQGVVTALHVVEGAIVRKGDALFTLSDELQSAALGGVQVEIARQMAGRRDSLLAERGQQQRLFAQQQRALGERLAAMGDEARQLEREVELLKARVDIARRNEAMHREQFRQGYIAEMRLQLVEAETLEQVVRLGALERSLMSARRELATVGAELEDLPFKLSKELALLDRSLAQLGQERVEAEARREIVVSAPGDGTVTAIHAVVGAGINSTLPQMSIVPADNPLEAHLYGPSRAVGFVRPGQRVLVRYQAFPYQRFGHHEGVVASVSRTAVNASDLPAPLAGQGAGGAAGSSSSGEPAYRIVVALASQAVSAYGEPKALQPGMSLEAEVALERRRLVEWVLDPIHAVTGKWQP
jgi:membrane fusion protein